MHKIFSHISKKDYKILKRELAFAHTTITLLSLGMLGLLSVIDQTADGYVRGLIDVSSALLILVALISTMITVYIVKTK
jgi:hypothetical protein